MMVSRYIFIFSFYSKWKESANDIFIYTILYQTKYSKTNLRPCSEPMRREILSNIL